MTRTISMMLCAMAIAVKCKATLVFVRGGNVMLTTKEDPPRMEEFDPEDHDFIEQIQRFLEVSK